MGRKAPASLRRTIQRRNGTGPRKKFNMNTFRSNLLQLAKPSQRAALGKFLQTKRPARKPGDRY